MKSQGPFKSEQSYRILENVRGYEHVENRTLSQIDADMIVVALTGSRSLKEVNERNISYDKSVKSPSLGFSNHLHKKNQVQVNGKLDYEGFLKALELISMKLFQEWDSAKAVRHVVEKHFLKLEQQITQQSIEQNKAVTGQPLQLLVDILKDPEIVKQFYCSKMIGRIFGTRA